MTRRHLTLGLAAAALIGLVVVLIDAHALYTATKDY